MAVLSRITGPVAYPAALIPLVFSASTPAGDTVKLTGHEILLVRNSGATPRTVTITSQPDPYGRVKHITAQSIAAGVTAIFGPIRKDGWADSTGALNLASEHAEITYAVVTLHK